MPGLLLLLLLLLQLGVRLVCIILALILLPLHHVVDSGRIRAETNSVHCSRSGQVKQWPTAQPRYSTLRRPHQGAEEGGTRGGQDLKTSSGRIRRFKPIGRGWTVDRRYRKSPTGWGAGDLTGRSGQMIADRSRGRSNYLKP